MKEALEARGFEFDPQYNAYYRKGLHADGDSVKERDGIYLWEWSDEYGAYDDQEFSSLGALLQHLDQLVG